MASSATTPSNAAPSPTGRNLCPPSAGSAAASAARRARSSLTEATDSPPSTAARAMIGYSRGFPTVAHRSATSRGLRVEPHPPGYRARSRVLAQERGLRPQPGQDRLTDQLQQALSEVTWQQIRPQVTLHPAADLRNWCEATRRASPIPATIDAFRAPLRRGVPHGCASKLFAHGLRPDFGGLGTLLSTRNRAAE